MSFAPLAPVAGMAAVMEVTTVSNSGPGSLRQAILEANANPGVDTIMFAIGTPGSVQTLQPTSALPTITEPLFLDGWSQGGSGYSGPPLIELNGALAGSQVSGLHFTGGGSTVRGLAISGFLGTFASGIRLQTGGSNWIYGNYIGTDITGTSRVANHRGIWIDGGSSHNRIGTDANGLADPAERNVISGNIDQNIWVYQPATVGTRIMGNYIGLNAAGTAALGTNNQTVAVTGILIQEAAETVIGTDGDGDGDALEGNVIGGNIYNISLTGISTSPSRQTRISGNRIGVNVEGTASVGLQVEGVRLLSTEGTVIGTDGDGVSDALEGNLISGHSDWGILFGQQSPRNNVVAGNKIGTDITGLGSIRNGYTGSPRGGIYLGGYGNRIGSDLDGVSDALERNLISGNTNVSVNGILSQFVDQSGAVPNTIAGNWIGVDATGLAALPNDYGISGASRGLTVRDNVIAANRYSGIDLNLTASSLKGNFIGVGADGVTPLGNGQHGIQLFGSDNQIGGPGPGEGNVIAYNGGPVSTHSGIALHSATTNVRNTFRGNRIFANTRLGINLALNGVTPNDGGDVDIGANNLQNFPLITFAQGYNNGTTVAQGTLNSHPNTSFTLDFYYSAAADSTGYGEGEHYLGAVTVQTDASGNATFDVTFLTTLPPNQFVTATATHADGSTSEFSPAYAAGGVVDVPIGGLAIQATPPVYTNLPVQFTASVSAGTGVSYEWDFGDGGLGSGAVVAHTFTTSGTYTVTVTAENNGGSASATSVITVLEPANINGVVWIDRDGDGFFGLGENVIFGQGMTISATLQEPPHTVLNGTVVNGNYQIFTPQPGVYLVEAPYTAYCTFTTTCFSTPNPVAVAVSEDGGTELNFGLMPGSFSPQPEDDGYIVGRAWLDLNANGFPDLNEFPLNTHTVRLRDAEGDLVATTTTGAAWGYGSYAFRITEPGLYRVQMDAPAGNYPSSREVEVYVSDRRVVNAQLPFLQGGIVSGQITDSSGASVAGTAAHLQPGDVPAIFFPGGYFFGGLDHGTYTVRITPPPGFVTDDGITERVVETAPNISVVENWTLLKKGELIVKAVQVVNGQALPIDFVPFELLLNGNHVRLAFTNPHGEARFEGLAPGTYVVKLWSELASIFPGLSLAPAERTAVVSNDSAATLSFTGTLSRSINIHAWLPGSGSPPVGFYSRYEIRTSGGSAFESGDLTPEHPATSLWNPNPATLEVRIIPDPTVPGQEGWPTYSQVVVLEDNTHANVYYPYNPANRQSIQGYAFRDHCVPAGVRANGSNCNEAGVPGNNGLTVRLLRPDGSIYATAETTFGTQWNTGFFSFDDLPVGEYRVAITFPSNYTPTTPTEVVRFLDGIAASEQIHFGYQSTQAPTLTGRVFIDADGNGSYDAAWDDAVPGVAVGVRTLSGTAVAALTSASDGSFQVTGLPLGEYSVTVTYPEGEVSRPAAIFVANSIVFVDFPLAPPGGAPRVLVFADANQNGLADPGEQRFGGVTVQLIAGACDEPGTLLETVLTGSDGVAVFSVPPAGEMPLCARITQGLPPNTVPYHLPGVMVPRGSGLPVPAPVVPSLDEPPLEIRDGMSIRRETFSLIFRSTPGRSYTIEGTVDLNLWRQLANATIYDFGYSQRVDVPLDSEAGTSFFRISER